MIKEIKVDPNENGEYIIIQKGQFICLFQDGALKVSPQQFSQSYLINRFVDLKYFHDSNINYTDRAVFSTYDGGIPPNKTLKFIIYSWED